MSDTWKALSSQYVEPLCSSWTTLEIITSPTSALSVAALPRMYTPRRIEEKVVPTALGGALAKAPELLAQLCGTLLVEEADQAILVQLGNTCDEVGYGV